VIVKGRSIKLIHWAQRCGDCRLQDRKTPEGLRGKEGFAVEHYAIAVKEILELNPVRLVFTICRIMSGRNDAGREAVGGSAGDSARTAAEIRAREFTAKPGFHCRGCSYKRFVRRTKRRWRRTLSHKCMSSAMQYLNESDSLKHRKSLLAEPLSPP